MHGYAVRLRSSPGAVWARPLAMLGFALLTALAALVRVPLPGTPVPLTLQVFVVLLAGAGLGRGYGAGSQLLYLGLGAAGAPLFAQCAGGLTLFGCPTGGYLAAFPAMAWIAGAFARRGSALRRLPAMLAALVPLYLLGSLHLALVLQAPLGLAVAWGVAPFVLADAAKAGAAAVVAARLTPAARG